MSDPRPAEAVIVRLRPHGRRLVGPLALLVLDVGAAVYVVGILPAEWMRWVALGAAALIAVAGVLVPVLRWATSVATITTRRLVVRSGILVHTRQELPHARGYGITVRRSGLQHLVRTADVTVTAGEDPPLVLRDVPQPHLVAETLHELVARSVPRGPHDW